MKILIIGSKGMLGQYVTQVLKDYDLVCWDKDQLDITNQNQVNTKIVQLVPDIIINCAAYNNVDKAESQPDLANLINGYAVGYLAKTASEIGALIVHFSTNYVFNGDNKNGYLESDTPDPQSIYGLSKFLGEQELRKNSNKYYLIRTSRLFGKEGSSENCKKNFVDLIIETAEKNNKIKVVDEEYDLPTYAFDLAYKTMELIESKFNYGIYHIVNSGEPCSWYDFAREIFYIKNIETKITPVASDAFGNRPAKRLRYGALKNTKLKHLRDWKIALKEYLGGKI